MSLSSTKDTYKDNISADIVTFMMTFYEENPEPTETKIRKYAEDFADMLATTIVDNMNAWLEANKRKVKTAVEGGSSAGTHTEYGSNISGLEID
jgi:hypothetical protein